MEEKQIVTIGSFCLNEACEEYKKVHHGNMMKYGQTDKLLGDRNSLAAIHRIKGVKEETVCKWLERAASHVEQFEEGLVRKHKLSRVQTDALWTYVGHQGEKGGSQRKRREEHFGAESPLT